MRTAAVTARTCRGAAGSELGAYGSRVGRVGAGSPRGAEFARPQGPTKAPGHRVGEGSREQLGWAVTSRKERKDGEASVNGGG